LTKFMLVINSLLLSDDMHILTMHTKMSISDINILKFPLSNFTNICPVRYEL